MRLDTRLVELGLCESRTRATDAIKAGLVRVNKIIANKANTDVNEGDEIEIEKQANIFVSAGGLKLQKAIEDLNISFEQKRVLDVGASTGGFTHCALHYNAAHVFAVDVGNNQLHQTLKDHPKVSWLENTDIRTFNLQEQGISPFDIIVADVSFMSLSHIIPVFSSLLTDEGIMVLLIKPQFEVGTKIKFKGGIVNNPPLHEKILTRIISELNDFSFEVQGITFAPVSHNKNIEYLFYITQGKKQKPLPVSQIIKTAFSLK